MIFWIKLNIDDDAKSREGGGGDKYYAVKYVLHNKNNSLKSVPIFRASVGSTNILYLVEEYGIDITQWSGVA